MTDTRSIAGTETAGRRGLFLRILLLALAFWAIDALLYAVAYGDDGFVDALLSPEPLELWLRVLGVAVIAAGALFIDRAGRRAGKAGFERELDDLGVELDEAAGRLQAEASEREAADRALRASESRYRGLFESSPTPILVVDQATGRILEANPAADAFVGHEPGKLATMRIWELDEEPEDETLERLADIAERGSRVVRSRYRLADGSWRDVEVTNAPIALDDGTTLLYGTVTDISDRIMVQEAMEAAFDELEQVFQSAADGLRVVATDYSIMKINDTFAELCGLSEDKLLGQKCYDVFSGVQCNTPACPVKRILDGAPRVDFEADKKRVDGSSVPCLVTARPYYVEGVLMGVVESFRDISERRVAEDTIRHMALHDHLTGLPNRTLLSDRLEMALTRARRHSEGLAVLFMDIDGFKEINDEMGHAAGDKLLADFARRIQGVLREEDTMARMGGDEFVVLLPGATRRADVARVLDEITRASSTPFEWEGDMAYVGASIGVAILEDPSESQDSLLKRADHAMYAAKECGGGAAFAGPGDGTGMSESGQPAAQCADEALGSVAAESSEPAHAGGADPTNGVDSASDQAGSPARKAGR